MSASGRSQRSLDAFVRPSTAAITELLPSATASHRPRSPGKRPRTDSDSYAGSEPDLGRNDSSNKAVMDEMDFQHTEHVTATQAIRDADDSSLDAPQMASPLSPEHAAIRADFEIITATAMEQLYTRITAEVNASVTASFQKTASQLNQQISLLNARITQMQQQLLTNQHPTPPTIAPTAAPVKKVLKKTMTKKATAENATRTTTTADDATPVVASVTLQMPSTNLRGWETVAPKIQKPKAAPPKLIPTKYPQAEREVTCYFQSGDADATSGTHLERTYSERQTMADTALLRVNSAIVDNKDVLAPAFIRARVTLRGNIIFTTGNTQNNLIYEDYTTIITDALSYYGQCQKVEIGKRFSQFLLHGVPTYLSLPEISDSLTANYPQLAQGQTPRWLTQADRREHKANSTIVVTLTGNVKKASIGRQHLIVCNHKCQLDDYIAYGRSTQCRNCQAYGHPAALCRNGPRCAVCADPHETREHPYALPVCRKGPACTHPPIRCINCDAPHKASDPNCSERIKLRNIPKTNTNTTNQRDAPMAGVAD